MAQIPTSPSVIGGQFAAALYVIIHVTISAMKIAEGKRYMISVTLSGQCAQAETVNSITSPPLC
jgi:hypothetical protein